jgi:hypothetical protein
MATHRLHFWRFEPQKAVMSPMMHYGMNTDAYMYLRIPFTIWFMPQWLLNRYRDVNIIHRQPEVYDEKEDISAVAGI